jgi:hypothetical protein
MIKHSMVSGIVDDGDASKVGPNAWNADHVIDDGTLTVAKTSGLQAALDAKSAAAHGHAIADTTGLQTALDGKSGTAHTHTIANVTSLQSSLDGKAATAHGHAIADVTGLQAALDGKSAIDHTHAGGGDDARLIVGALTSNHADVTGTGLVEIAGLTKTIGIGIWKFEYFMVYQTTALTTGVEFVVDHTGADTVFVSNAEFGTGGGANATGTADQVGVGTAAGMMEVKTQRVAGARPGVTIGVDTANANCLMVVRGVIRVSVSGDLKIFLAAELAGLVCRAMAGSCVSIVKCG